MWCLWLLCNVTVETAKSFWLMSYVGPHLKKNQVFKSGRLFAGHNKGTSTLGFKLWTSNIPNIPPQAEDHYTSRASHYVEINSSYSQNGLLPIFICLPCLPLYMQ